MKNIYILLLILIISCSGHLNAQPKPNECVTHDPPWWFGVGHKIYTNRVYWKDITSASLWNDKQEDAPKLSPKAAMKLAEDMAEKTFPSSKKSLDAGENNPANKDRPWHVKSINLERIGYRLTPDDRWLYNIALEGEISPVNDLNTALQFRKGIPNGIRIIVLMDGKVITPVRQETAGETSKEAGKDGNLGGFFTFDGDLYINKLYSSDITSANTWDDKHEDAPKLNPKTAMKLAEDMAAKTFSIPEMYFNGSYKSLFNKDIPWVVKSIDLQRVEGFDDRWFYSIIVKRNIFRMGGLGVIPNGLDIIVLMDGKAITPVLLN